MEEEKSFRFICPECGYPLSVYFTEDENEELVIEFYCEGPGEDTFSFQLKTGVSNEDIPILKTGKPLATKAITKLLYRQSESDFKAEKKGK